MAESSLVTSPLKDSARDAETSAETSPANNPAAIWVISRPAQAATTHAKHWQRHMETNTHTHTHTHTLTQYLAATSLIH